MSTQPIAIEHLCFRVPPGGQAEFLEQDARIWGSPLRNHPGFLRKEVWLDKEDPELIHIIIHWSSRADWKAFPPEQVEALDREMQPFYVHLEQAKEYQLWQAPQAGQEG
ncbi:MAG: TIGR03792 family protein [Thermostichus sp. HHBFW_bins_43]